jgi:hypothetical protein
MLIFDDDNDTTTSSSGIVAVEGSRDLPVLLKVMILLLMVLVPVEVLMDDDSFLELTNPRLKVDSLTLLDI